MRRHTTTRIRRAAEDGGGVWLNVSAAKTKRLLPAGHRKFVPDPLEAGAPFQIRERLRRATRLCLPNGRAWTCLLTLAFVFGVLATATHPANAINIIWETLSNTTHPGISPGQFDSEPPTNDPTSSGLLNVLEHVEDVYQDAFEDAETIRITYWWDADLAGGGQSIPSLIFENPVGNLTHAIVRFSSLSSYYIDSTPANDSEYSLSQLLYDFGPRALSAPAQAARFAGNVPDVFEAGFNGPRAPNSPVPNNQLDLLTVAFQEVGHSLGMNAGFTGVTNGGSGEVDDGDYDVNPNFVRSSVMQMLPRGGTSDPLDHLRGNDAVMASLGSDERTRPSVADFFAIAAVQGWTNVDLPRQDFLGGTNWNNAGNWMGNQTPGAFDTAYVRRGGTVSLNANDTIDTLFIDNNSTVFTGANRLTGLSALAVQQTTGPGSSFLSIPLGGEAVTDLLFVNAFGRVLMTGGAVDANDIVVTVGGLISGNGTIDISDGIGELVNDGRIFATGGTLTINSTNGVALDLDGVLENGVLEATFGDLILNSGSVEDFNGRATVGAGRELAFNSGISIGAGGLVEINGTATNAAEVSGLMFVGNAGTVLAEGRAIIGTLLLGSGGVVRATDAATELRLNGTTFFQGGFLAGAGRAHQTGDAIVQRDTTITVATYDMDGLNGTSSITVEPGRTLNIDSAQVENIADDGYDGTLNIDGGVVDIQAAWLLDGTLNINDDGGVAGELTGAGGVTLAGTSQLNIIGAADITTSVVANGGADVFVDGQADFSGPTTLGLGARIEVNDPGDSIVFRGNTTLVGPNFVGGGRLIFDGDVNVALVDTSIGLSETDLDGPAGTNSITINDGITFSISSTTIEPNADGGFDGTILNRGTFSVLAGWRLDGQLTMDPNFGNTATLSGFGPFEIDGVGTMTTFDDVVVTPDTLVRGTINVNSGTTLMSGQFEASSSASVNIAAGAELELAGPTTIDGGSYAGGGTLQLNSPTDVIGSTTIDVAVVDLDGTVGNTQLTLHNAGFTLNVDRIDLPSVANQFNGTINVNGQLAQLRIQLSDPNASWEMAGTMNLTGGFPIPQTALAGSDVFVSGTINTDSLVFVTANIDLSGTLTTADASTNFVFAGAGEHTIRSSAVVSGPGRISVSQGATLTLEDGVALGVDLHNSGRLQLGASPGIASVSGDFSQSLFGALEIELGGELLSEHDQLSVTGTVDLAGELVLALIDGFDPAPYHVINIVSATGGVAGIFDTVSDVAYSDDFGLAVTYGPNSVDVRAALLGDANLDGTVDGQDFLIWNASKFSDGNSWATGDFNGDGTTDGQDFLIWNGNKFTSVSRTPAVPEPAALNLLLLGCLTGVPYLRDRDPRRPG